MASFSSRYCNARGLTRPRAQCDPGYICIRGAYTSTPTDNVTGSICPRGGYCGYGRYESEPCPQGRYSTTSGATNEQDCRECDPGFFCASTSAPEPNGPCDAGYYCKKGSTTPTQHEADPGYYAPVGTSDQLPCAVGTYNPNRTQGSCSPCNKGHYCPETRMSISLPCNPGFYCPIGSQVQFDCPPGTYNNKSNQNSLDDCLPCPAGKYCKPTNLLGY